MTSSRGGMSKDNTMTVGEEREAKMAPKRMMSLYTVTKNFVIMDFVGHQK